MQNHLTEIMTLLTMKVPQILSSSEEVLRNKLQIFSHLQPVGTKQAVIGQYQAYTAEVREELNKTTDQFSVTPTFAGEYHKVALDDRFPQTLK
jgi:hexose-6-phosphate dehydrogenase